MKKGSHGVEENPHTHSTALPPITEIPLGNAAPPEVWSTAVGSSLLLSPFRALGKGQVSSSPLKDQQRQILQWNLFVTRVIIIYIKFLNN